MPYSPTLSQRTTPLKQGRPWPNGSKKGVSQNILWGSQSGILSVPTLMRRRLCFGLSMASPPMCKPGYVPRNLLICSQPCKWLNKSDRRLPMLIKMTNVTVKDPWPFPFPSSSPTGITHQWSLAPQRRSVGAATYVASMGIRQRNAPRVKRQLPTLLPTVITVAEVNNRANLTICSSLLINCSLLLVACRLCRSSSLRFWRAGVQRSGRMAGDQPGVPQCQKTHELQP